ncbi:hypothetical protein HF324_29790 [Chitinophaga oryzae]|uniref:DUF3347 domain-containing protein n=1 Tax=Chitinophaga oryzae TaxID=2725414 RepID=A0AAE6ZNX6_9BACT|nr:hypothetical protein [Chitinophaga oryzae]QJB35275.1 hypothetical protein HF329_29815 [Chitinophaga oryzae]QJB41810.1 hypothetical protein HF324_29790 [Chitinophaga oryzae]
MKKLVLLLMLAAVVCSNVNAAANLILPQAPTMNVEGTASSIVSKLDKSLRLTDKQKPRLLTIVAAYLQQKVNIQPLQQTNSKAYATKLNSMQNGLHNKLKALLTPSQYTEFTGLKPKTFDETNVLSQLYY